MQTCTDKFYFDAAPGNVRTLSLACVALSTLLVLLVQAASGGLSALSTVHVTATGSCHNYPLNLSSVSTWLPLDKDGRSKKKKKNPQFKFMPSWGLRG